MTSSLPLRIPPPAVNLRPVAASTAALTESIKATRVKRRPSTVPKDVWEIVEEITDVGGLFDLTVEVARLEAMHREIDALAQPNDQNEREMLPSEAVRLRMKLTRDIAALKSRAAEISLKTKDIITLDVFRLIMDGFSAVLARNIPTNPTLVQRISDDMGDVMRAALTQVSQGRRG